MSKQTFNSWGRVEKPLIEFIDIANRFADYGTSDHGDSFLAYGNGRSYGDSCLNPGGTMLLTRSAKQVINFDPQTGVLQCEGGVLLSEILALVVPQGWFLPVTPGTRFVTVGGAIANDVHGKNHHVTGTFGCHVSQFELLRSDGQRLICSEQQHRDFFAATIGGLGLTGLITWVELKLRPINNAFIKAETIRYRSLDEFFALCAESDENYEYTVSWVDCSGTGKRIGRGLFMRGNHAPALTETPAYQSKNRTFFFEPPISLVNALTLKLFNTAYYYKQLPDSTQQMVHYEPFFYPLDGILEWNRLYGPKGFYQYQCVVPTEAGKEATTALLNEIANSGMGSFLAVLKVCGEKKSPGMLSFPLPGISLALDFPNRGQSLHELFKRLDAIVLAANGRLYPAKDGRMPASLFQAGYPNWQAFSQYIDPHFSSSFWRRVSE